MIDQTIVNTAAAALCAVMGWLLKSLWQAVKDLQKADAALVEKVNKIEVLVAGDYVKKEDFDRTIQRLFEKLDQIEAKLDKKADR